MEKSLKNFEDDTTTIEFGLVTSLCLWLGNESLFGNVLRDDKQRQFELGAPMAKRLITTYPCSLLLMKKYYRFGP